MIPGALPGLDPDLRVPLSRPTACPAPAPAALGIAALGVVALLCLVPTRATRAQQPVDLDDTRGRPVATQTLRQALDPQGGLARAPDGPREVGELSFQGDTAQVVVRGRDRAAVPPILGAMSAAGVIASLENARFTNLGDRTTRIDLGDLSARTASAAEGVLDLRFLISGEGVNQPLRFSVTRFAATDMGPLFLGDALFSTDAPEDPQAPPNIVLPGTGRVCAMPGSPFLDPMIGVPDCTRGNFGELTRIDPQPLDPRTGELRAVGVQRVTVEPFRAFGFEFPLAPISLFDLEQSALRLSER